MKQLALLKNEPKAYGGELRRDRNRRGARPLSTRESMHIVLRSSKARGSWSFLKNGKRIVSIIDRFALKYGVKVHNIANVGNHIHMHVKLGNRFAYPKFIRAVTAAIAMAVTGKSRWNKIEKKFWDYRPFTRVVTSLRGFLNLRDYVRINRLEGGGVPRVEAYLTVRGDVPTRKATRTTHPSR